MIHSKLEETRRALLDLTRRNRLLNFRPDASGVVRIAEESAGRVYRQLSDAAGPLRLASAEESPPGPGAGGPGGPGAAAPPAPGEPPPAAPADRPEDDVLRTPHAAEDLDRRLLHLAREAESALQEQGCNILFLAAGLVEWTDRLDSKVRSLAPVVLLPVELVRRSVRRRHALRLLDEEPVVNPVFQELCRAQLGLRLPDFDAEAPDPVGACLAGVGAAIRPLRSWALRGDMHLALLSFSKLLMYLDLDDARWPAGSKVSEHPRVLSLLGLASAWPRPEPPPDPAELDDRVPPQETFQVLDADSSQGAAVHAAKAGTSLVIQGPPGTGKSQTITNIIAECLSRGRTVLFVAEKAAALDVVHRRLTQVGLGAFTAALHSRKASKRAFMEDLARTLALDPRPLHARQRLNPEDLARLRADLNLYVRALHRPIQPLGLSAYEAIGRALALGGAPEAPVALEDPLRWDAARLRRAEDALTACAAATRKIGDPASHPWRGVGIDDLPLARRQQAERAVHTLLLTLVNLQRAGERLAVCLTSRAAPCAADGAALAGHVGAALRAPPLLPGAIAGGAWDAPPPGLAELIAAGRRLEEIREELGDRWKAGAEAEDWAATAACYRNRASSRLRWLSSAWWRARAKVRAWLKPGAAHPGNARVAGDLARLVEAAGLRRQASAAASWAAPLFGPMWKGDESDWDRLGLYAEAGVALRAAVRAGLMTEGGAASLADPARRDQAAVLGEELRRAAARFSSDLRDAAALLALDVPAFFGGDPERMPFTAVGARLRECEGKGEALVDWVARVRARAGCVSAGLAAFLEWADATPHVSPDRWAGAFRRQFHRLWADAAIAEAAPLRGFRGEEQERAIGVFRQLDREWLEDTRRRLVAGVAAARPRVGGSLSENSGLGILEAQLRRQRNIMSIRRLLASPAGAAVLRIKPCFMMSPLSVAQHLEPGRLKFDVVIFDEASQVEPADALGAVARAGQIILVGDEKQLPPTNFFASVVADAEGEGRGGGEGGGETEFDIPVGDLESVLALGAACLPRATLRWHYRSRHPSLIEFSNREFYDQHLRVFPSPSAARGELGLSLVRVEGAVYQRGKGQFNAAEARRVAEAVAEHARRCPDLSLGVGAFSVAQQRAIEDEIEALRRGSDDPALEAFFDPSREEPFFVKNLETVQGDERDVMLLSVGYGPDERGRVTMNFGPLNQEGGWRRLNVLVTRARRRCVVFSSLRPEQVRAEADTPRGVRALRAFLAYAAGTDPASPAGAAPGEGPTQAFERVVAGALRGAGWTVHEGVGGAGFALDLGVVDRDDPTRYLVGIECDGPTYHALPTARDRDRLRRQVLEGLGWTILRVWAPDWFQQPRRSLEQLRRQIDEVAAGAGRSAPAVLEAQRPPSIDGPASGGDDDPQPEEEGAALPEGVRPYERFKGRRRGDRERLLRTRADALASLVREIVSVEGPVHRDEVARLAAGLYDCRPVGQALERLAEGVEAAVGAGAVRRVGDFLWPAGMERPPLRWRGTPGAVTAADLICVEEMVEAVAWVAEHEFGVPLDDLPAAAVRRLGFRRGGRALEALARAAVEAALRSGRIAAGADGLVRAGPGPA